ncbi:hypothetical protein KXD40_000821 [Peronospora effusa]|uniref:Uncharacterized protein n=1 Tax=Peronospora farinosa TaxID=134698 RepID=A0AAV0U2B9_9STRA|nr:hypothetical protein KXD40_000821 [Peronospora effusa]CAH0490509.1 unnamed protein product [Peronospora farinosa]CAI5731131.1 unnamed protein product [Peronospora farinosa]
MFDKYSNIRLSGTTKVVERKQRQIEATGARVQKTNLDHDYGDQVERLTSSCCQTESERGSTLTMLGLEPSQLGKRHKQQQPQQDEAHLDYWRMSETQTESEYGSDIPTTRLTRGLGNENCSLIGSLRASESDLVVSTSQETEENQHDCSSLSETDSSSSKCVEFTPTSITNQTDAPSELSRSLTMVGDSSRPSPSSTTTEALLPRLRPTAPLHCVVPNCCDYFTSPHPHYPKEVIGMAKIKESLQSVSASTNPINTDTTSEGADNERDDNDRGDNERGGHEREGGDRSNDSGVTRNNNEFEMWDYVCPQYARRYYANEWF